MSEKNHFSGDHIASHFEAVKANLPGADIDWLQSSRDEGMTNFLETGIPGPRVEEWKYTNLGLLKSDVFKNTEASGDIAADVVAAALLGGLNGPKVVFVDGYLSETHTNIVEQEGVELLSLTEFAKSNADQTQKLLLHAQNSGSLSNLNLAMMTGGYVLRVSEDVKLAEPIQIVHIASTSVASKSLRTLNYIDVEEGGRAQIIESFISTGGGSNWRQNNTYVTLARSAALEVYQYQTENSETIHMAETLVEVAEDADFKHFSLNIGGKMSRTEIKPTLIGENGNVELRGAFLGRDGVSHDVFTHMKHMVPECESDQIYRGVLDKGGKSAFQGRVYVAKDAQLTNAEQSNKNLILDRSAEANSKPELLIYADDVKCAHGATVGELDQDALFYLNSRGLDNKAAKALLVEAFVSEVFDEIDIEAVKDKYLTLAHSWLEQGE